MCIVIFNIKLYDPRSALLCFSEIKPDLVLPHDDTCSTRVVLINHNTNRLLSAGREPGSFITKDCPADFGKFAHKFNDRVDAKSVAKIASYIHLSVWDENGAAALTAGE